jgi:hypothetical protein
MAARTLCCHPPIDPETPGMPMLNETAGGVYAIAPTLFHDDGRIDGGSIDRMVDFYGQTGCTGITSSASWARPQTRSERGGGGGLPAYPPRGRNAGDRRRLGAGLRDDADAGGAAMDGGNGGLFLDFEMERGASGAIRLARCELGRLKVIPQRRASPAVARRGARGPPRRCS